MILTVLTKGILDGVEHASVKIENILARRRLATRGRGEAATPANAEQTA